MPREHHLMISLETHNPDNVPMYEHFGLSFLALSRSILI